MKLSGGDDLEPLMFTGLTPTEMTRALAHLFRRGVIKIPAYAFLIVDSTDRCALAVVGIGSENCSVAVKNGKVETEVLNDGKRRVTLRLSGHGVMLSGYEGPATPCIIKELMPGVFDPCALRDSTLIPYCSIRIDGVACCFQLPICLLWGTLEDDLGPSTAAMAQCN